MVKLYVLISQWVINQSSSLNVPRALEVEHIVDSVTENRYANALARVRDVPSVIQAVSIPLSDMVGSIQGPSTDRTLRPR
jgi:hypothetical protein